MKFRLAVATVITFLTGTVGSTQTQGRTEHYTFLYAATGVLIGNCGAFDILSDWEMKVFDVVVFDANGQPTRETAIYKVLGQSIYYSSTDPTKFVMGGPGEIETDHAVYEDGELAGVFFAGLSWKAVLPGYGPIFLETGRGVLDVATGDVVFNSGFNQFIDGDVAALCNALE